MKNAILKLALIALIPLTITEASAQCSPALRADIPFDFSVNDKQFKRGKYTLETAGCSHATPFVILRDAEGKSLGIVNRVATEIDSPKAPDQGRLVFVRYGDSYFLSEVRDPLGRYSFRVRPGTVEDLLARSTKQTPVTVQLDKRTKKKLEIRN